MFVYQRVTYISKPPLDYFGNIEANHWNAFDYDIFFCVQWFLYISLMERLIRMDGNIVKLGSMETTIHGLILGAIVTFIMFHHGSVDDLGSSRFSMKFWRSADLCDFLHEEPQLLVEAKQLLERKHFESRVSMGGTPIHFRFPSGPPSSWGTSIWKPYSNWVERFGCFFF